MLRKLSSGFDCCCLFVWSFKLFSVGCCRVIYLADYDFGGW